MGEKWLTHQKFIHFWWQMVHGWWCLLHEGKILGMTVHTLARIPSRAESTEASADVSQKYEYSKSSWGVWKQSNSIFCTGWTSIYMNWCSLSGPIWKLKWRHIFQQEFWVPDSIWDLSPLSTETTSVGPLSEKHAKLCVLPILDSCPKCQSVIIYPLIPSFSVLSSFQLQP